ncbi:MAG: T9SS type A sorting domain-containing protein [Flavobacteriales bacterium]|nr:T9SS type A sorting domain-containing protein [Flavobacteriales bacterium]
MLPQKLAQALLATLPLLALGADRSNPAALAAPGSTPPNTLCTGAGVVPVTIGTPVTVTGNNQGSLTDPVLGATLVWEGFTTTQCTDLTVSYCGTSPAFMGGLAYLGVGCPLTNLVFNNSAGVISNICGDGNFGIRFQDLPAGTYYYPVLEAPGSSGNYSISFIAAACTGVAPANAVCSAPIPLTPALTCTPTNATVAGATVAGTTGIGCGNGDVSDGVWFSFVATSSAHDITVVPSAEFAPGIELFSSACPATASLACGTSTVFGTGETVSSTSLVVGETYLVRVFDWYAGTPRTTTFDICVVEVPVANCDADAGTLTADASEVCLDGTVTVSATANGDAVVPSGYDRVYVLTSGQDLVIQQADAVPSFQVSDAGTYTVHTLVYDPATLDLGAIVFGESTAAEINALLIQGGGSTCAGLDLTGATTAVVLCCDALAGALDPVSSFECLVGGTSPVGAVVETPSAIPTGYVLAYVLSQGPDHIIQQLSTDPSFTVNALGAYTIHAFVYEPSTLDPEQAIVFGTTTAVQLRGLFVEGGGTICGSLDLSGAIITVLNCCTADAGSLTADDALLCYPNTPVTIGATANEDAVVPSGFTTTFVLTLGQDLVIQATAATPSFEVSGPGAYTIHTLVYDSATLDLGTIVIGETTGGDVNALLIPGGGSICASLDVEGAAIVVEDCRPLNDDCSAAIEVSVSVVEECSTHSVNGNNTYATQQVGNEPGCDATTASYADVWYRFNSAQNTQISLIFDPGTMTDWGIAVSDACEGGTELVCEINPAVPIDVTTVPNTDYWIRIYSDLGAGSGGSFTLCVSGAAPTYICDGASVTLGDGSTGVSICQDGDPDVLDVINSSNSIEDYSYVVMDENNIVVALMAMGSLDFNALPMGNYRIRGISHNGALLGTEAGADAADITTDGECIDFSSDFVSVTVEVCSNIQESEEGAWSLFPNPANADVNVRYAGMGTMATIEVIDMGGRLVLGQRTAVTNGQVLVLSGSESLTPGAYTVRLNDGASVTNLRLAVR